MWPYEPRLKALQQQCPGCQSQGWSWQAELEYRQFAKQLILNTGADLRLPVATQHRAVVLLHRFYSRSSSARRPDLSQWAVCVACLFLATKIDSAYHRLESVVHAAYVQLKHLKQEQYDREYFFHSTDPARPGRQPGNPAFLARLAGLARDAEMDVLFATNFDFNIEVPLTMAVYELRELGLSEARAVAEPAVKAARELAAAAAAVSITHKSSVVCLRFAPRQVALAAISWACGKAGVVLDLAAVDGAGYTPRMTPQELAAVEKALPKPVVPGSKHCTPAPGSSGGGSTAAAARHASAATGAAAGAKAPSSHGSGSASHTAVRFCDGSQQQQHHQRHHSTGGVAKRQLDASGSSGAAQAAKRACLAGGSSGRGVCGAAAAASAGTAGLGCSLGDGSACDALTTGPRVAPSPISPDSETGPAAAGAAAGSGDGSSARCQQQQQGCHAAGPGRPHQQGSCVRTREGGWAASQPQRQQQQQALPVPCSQRDHEGLVVA